MTPIYGGARFATTAERRRMKTGLELGIDPNTGRTVRVAVKGNLTTIAPPGSGKTSGLLLPNLAAPEKGAWFDPAVVIDPKGDAFKAVSDRRRALGRQAYCLDPMGVAGGGDRWNPFDNLDPDKIIDLQATVAALLPSPGVQETRYFREAAIEIIVAAFLAVHHEERPSPSRMAELLADQPAFAKALAGIEAVAAKSTLNLIENPPKNVMDLFSTAQQALRSGCPGSMDTDDAFARGVPLCPRHARLTRRSSGNRWLTWSEPAAIPRTSSESSSRPPRPSGTGWPRLTAGTADESRSRRLSTPP